MMRIELLAIMLFLGILSPDIAPGETKLYDERWNPQYRVEDDGRIYDRNWNLRGRIQEGKVYDRNWNVKGRIEGDRIYDTNWNLKLREGGRSYRKWQTQTGRTRD
jgi:hypothetical protein